MLIQGNKLFVEAPFKDEAELEKIVETHYEHLFGPSSLYLAKKRMIRTVGGTGTIPDAIAVDLAARRWLLIAAKSGATFAA